MLGLGSIASKLPISSLATMGINGAGQVLDHIQGVTPPLRFVAGYNLDYVIRIQKINDAFCVHCRHIDSGGLLCKGSTEYDEMLAYMQTQKVGGILTEMLNQLKTSG